MRHFSNILGLLLITIGMFSIMYRPPVLPFNTMHLVGLLSILYLLANSGLAGRVVSKNKRLLSWMAGVTIYLLLLMFIFSEKWTILTDQIFFLVDVIPFGAAISVYINKKNIYQYATTFVVKTILFAAFIQSILIIASIISPAIKEIFLSRIIAYGYDEKAMRWISSYRLFGFSDGLTFDTPMIHAMLSVFCVGLAQISKRKLWYYGSAILFFITAIVNARTPIIILAIGLISTLVFPPNKKTTGGRMRMVFTLGILAIIGVMLLPPLIQAISPTTYDWIVDGMGMMDTMMTGKEEQYWTDASKYKLPEGLHGLIIGAGHKIAGMGDVYGYSTDIGYINDIWKGGIIYVLLNDLGFLLIGKRLYNSNNYVFAFYGIIFIAMSLIVNVKGTVYDMNSVTNIMLIFLIIYRGSLSNTKVVTI